MSKRHRIPNTAKRPPAQRPVPARTKQANARASVDKKVEQSNNRLSKSLVQSALDHAATVLGENDLWLIQYLERVAMPDAYATVPPGDLEEAQKRAVEAMRIHGVKAESCRASRIGRAVLNKMLKEDAPFRERMRLARADCFEELERCMNARGKTSRGDLAGIFVLKHSLRKFREITRVELTGKDGGAVEYAESKGAILERLNKLANAVAVDAIVSDGTTGKPQLVQSKLQIKKAGS